MPGLVLQYSDVLCRPVQAASRIAGNVRKLEGDGARQYFPDAVGALLCTAGPDAASPQF
ncbi:hypothetical protein D3C81_1728810 [compost metagenome]